MRLYLTKLTSLHSSCFSLAGGAELVLKPPAGPGAASDDFRDVIVLSWMQSSSQEVEALAQRWGRRPVSFLWVIDSISRYAVLDPAGYAK